MVKILLARVEQFFPASLDKVLLFVIMSLLMLGLVMVYSASLPLPSDNERHLFWNQMRGHPLHLFLGILTFGFFLLVPTELLRSLSGAMFAFGLGLLLCVALLKFFGGQEFVKDGAVRSIPFGNITLQPAELMKFFAILFAAAYAIRRNDRIRDSLIRGIAPIGFLMIILITLLLYQPDLGSTIVITLTVGAVLFLGGMNLKVFIPLFLSLCAFFVLMIVSTPWRLGRLVSFVTPCDQEFSATTGYQLCAALVAFGNGGLLGTGLGTGVAKLDYLPLPHTDFIFAVIGEELGFIGISIVLVCFYYLIKRSIEIGRTAMSQDRVFAGLVSQGIGFWIGVQAFIHAGVNTGILPTKGLTLPFISHGGSSMLVVCAAMGVLLRIDMENKFYLNNDSTFKHKKNYE